MPVGVAGPAAVAGTAVSGCTGTPALVAALVPEVEGGSGAGPAAVVLASACWPVTEGVRRRPPPPPPPLQLLLLTDGNSTCAAVGGAADG
eukprot:203269-Pelagomonas_calceolata.AAC.1